MKAKVLAIPAVVALVVAGAVMGLVAASPGGEAIGGSRSEKAFVDAQGNPIVGVKDFADTGEGWPEQNYYTTGPFVTTASEEDAATIGALLRRSVVLEYSAMLSSNSMASLDAMKAQYAEMYSDVKGDLTKHLGFIGANAALLTEDGFEQTELRLTRFEVKGIDVQGDQAAAVVEEESLGVRARVPDQPTPDTLTIKNGRQTKFYLVREEGAWLILGESWAFLPGMGP